MKKKVSALLLCLLLALTPMLGACSGKVKTSKDVTLSSYADSLYDLRVWDTSLASQLVTADSIPVFDRVEVGGVMHKLVYLRENWSSEGETYDGLFNITRHTRLFETRHVYPSEIENGDYIGDFEYSLIGPERRIVLRTANDYTDGVAKPTYSAKTLDGDYIFDGVEEYELEEYPSISNVGVTVTAKITTKFSYEGDPWKTPEDMNETIYIGYDDKHPEHTVIMRGEYSSGDDMNERSAEPRFVDPSETESLGLYAGDFILVDFLVAETENYDGGKTIQFFDKYSGKATKLVLPAHTRDFAYSDGKILYTVFTPVPFDAKSGYNLYVEGKSGDKIDHGKSKKYDVGIYSFDIRKGKTKTLRPGYIPMEFEAVRRGNAFDALDVTAAPISGGVAYYSEVSKSEYLTDEQFKVGFDLTRLGIDMSYLYTISDNRMLTRTPGDDPLYLIIDKEGKTVASLGTDAKPVRLDNKVVFIARQGGKYGLLDADGKITHPFEYDSITQTSRGIVLESSTKESLFIDRGTGNAVTIDNTFLDIGNDETLVEIAYDRGYYLTRSTELRFRFIGNRESSWGFYFDDEYGSLSDYTYDGEVVGLQRSDNYEILLFAL